MLPTSKQFFAELNYPKTELQPILSEETIEFHYGKHHMGYANTLNQLIASTEWNQKSLRDIIVKSRTDDIKIFNNASQLFNHNFYWNCLKLSQPEMLRGKLKQLIENQFGCIENFLSQYISFANNMFGSGWSWLVLEDQKLSFFNTQNAENPVGTNKTPICVVDMWEHSYYIDYRNNRVDYVNNIVKKCINWEFCENQII